MLKNFPIYVPAECRGRSLADSQDRGEEQACFGGVRPFGPLVLLKTNPQGERSENELAHFHFRAEG